MTENITTYNAAVSYLNDTPRFTEKHTLEQTKQLLALLGSPEESFRIIHIAGSNGKGSVCMMIASILNYAGYSCGLFTSPHLVTTRERFRINGGMISQEQFTEDFLEIRQMLFDHPACPHPTYFEYLYLMAMIRFRKAGVDAAVIETGLGGRLDATNAAEHPDVTVITSIGLEHTEHLGSTIREIAAEKAGIIKPYVPVFYDASDPEAAEVIRETASVRHAPAYAVTAARIRNVRPTGNGIAFTCAGEYDLFQLRVPSPAEYQILNAALAANAAERFLISSSSGPRTVAEERHRYDLSRKEVIEAGIAACRLPGRMEIIQDGVILDGAHNPAGINAFLKSVRNMTSGGQILLFACMRDKNYKEMIRSIASSGLWETVIAASAGSGRECPPEELAALLAEAGTMQVLCVPDPQEALGRARRIRRRGQYIFAAGSFYLIGALESGL